MPAVPLAAPVSAPAPARSTTIPHEISTFQETISHELANVYTPIIHEITNNAYNAGIVPMPIGQVAVAAPPGMLPPGSISTYNPVTGVTEIYNGSTGLYSYQQTTQPQPAAARAVYSGGYTSAEINAMLGQITSVFSTQQSVNASQLQQIVNLLTTSIQQQQREVANDSHDISISVTNPIQREIIDNSRDIDEAVARVQSQINQELSHQAINIEHVRQEISEQVTREISTASENTAALARTVEQNLHETIDNSNKALHEISTAVEDFKSKLFPGDFVPVLVSFKNIGQDATNVAEELGTQARQSSGSIEDFFASLIKTFLPNLSEILGIDAEGFPNPFERLIEAWHKLERGEYKNLDEFIAEFEGTEFGTTIAKIILITASIIPILLQIASALAAPTVNRFNQLSNANQPTALLGMPDLMEAFRRGAWDTEKIMEELGKYGVDSERLEVLGKIVTTLLDYNTIREFTNRGFISQFEALGKLAKIGYEPDDVENLIKSFEIVPPLQDIISMARRDVFNPQRRKLFGLDEEYPKLLTEWGEKQGLSEEMSRNYWAAHWILPSPTQAYEWLHRKLITESELRQILLANDFMPAYIQHFIDAAYENLTRVDIRRMYKAGVLNDEQIHKAHLAIGYNETNAKFLDEFVRKTNLPEDESELNRLEKRVNTAIERAYATGKITIQEAHDYLIRMGNEPGFVNRVLTLIDLEQSLNQTEVRSDDLRKQTVNMIFAAYKKGNLPRNDANNQLAALGYDGDEINKQLNLLDIEIAVRLKGLMQDSAQKQYASHQIEIDQFRGLLAGMGFAPGEINMALQEAIIMRNNKEKKLTLTQLKKLQDKGVLSIDEYRNELLGMGYQVKYVDWLTELEYLELE